MAIIPKELRGIAKGFLKAIIIIFVIIYVISPIDAMPGFPLDDIIVAVLGLSFAGIDLPNLFGTAKSAKKTYRSKKKK